MYYRILHIPTGVFLTPYYIQSNPTAFIHKYDCYAYLRDVFSSWNRLSFGDDPSMDDAIFLYEAGLISPQYPHVVNTRLSIFEFEINEVS